MRIVSRPGLAAALATCTLLAACGGEAPATEEEVVVDETAAEAPTVDGDTDALVEGTEYNATTQVPCSTDGSEPTASCAAGVKRQFGDDGSTMVEVTRPDGTTRAIFFMGTEAQGADSSQADGSAGWDFSATHEGEETRIEFGPERYVIPDILVVGG